MALRVEHFLHAPTHTFSYVAWDDESRAAAVIDPVLDYDAAAGRTSTASAGQIVAFARSRDLEVAWILETHAHADHLSAAPFLKASLGGQIGIGAGIRAVQGTFRHIYNLDDLAQDGSQFDGLFEDGDTLPLGTLSVTVMATPGHTSDSVSYRIGDAVFVGDTLFAPDQGTARTDFPGGDARLLFRSIRKLLSLPVNTRMFLCHDYPDGSRQHEHVHTVQVHRDSNIHVHEGMNEDRYVELRETRDATLDVPALIIPAVQVNVRAGRFPPAEDNGTIYLKVPIDRFGG